MKAQVWSRLREAPRLRRRDWIWTLGPALLWLAAAKSRPWLMALGCARNPESCARQGVPELDAIAIGRVDAWADSASFVTQNWSGYLAFTLAPVWALASLFSRGAGWRAALAAAGADLVLVGQAALWNGLAMESIRLLVQRPRPFVYADPGYFGANPAHYTSFYSGHTSFAAAAGFSLAFAWAGRRAPGWLVTLAALAAAVATGLTGAFRVMAGRHFPSDVFFGALAGLGAAFAVAWLHRRPATIGKLTAGAIAALAAAFLSIGPASAAPRKRPTLAAPAEPEEKKDEKKPATPAGKSGASSGKSASAAAGQKPGPGNEEIQPKAASDSVYATYFGEQSNLPLQKLRGRFLFIQLMGQASPDPRKRYGGGGALGFQWQYLTWDVKGTYAMGKYGTLMVYPSASDASTGMSSVSDSGSEYNRVRGKNDAWSFILIEPGLGVHGRMVPDIAFMSQRARFGMAYGLFTDKTNGVKLTGYVLNVDAAVQIQFGYRLPLAFELGGSFYTGFARNKALAGQAGRIPLQWGAMNASLWVWI